MSYEVQEGDFIQVIDIYGRQCSDFMAFDADKLHKGQELGIDTTNSRYLMGSGVTRSQDFIQNIMMKISIQ